MVQISTSDLLFLIMISFAALMFIFAIACFIFGYAIRSLVKGMTEISAKLLVLRSTTEGINPHVIAPETYGPSGMARADEQEAEEKARAEEVQHANEMLAFEREEEAALARAEQNIMGIMGVDVANTNSSQRH